MYFRVWSKAHRLDDLILSSAVGFVIVVAAWAVIVII